MKIVILSGGDAPSYELVKEELKDSTYLICADGGGNFLYKYNLIPNYLMGDFDSIDKEALGFFKKSNECIVETYPKEKNFTDTELVLDKALKLGADEIVLLGCTGNRVDHMMGNLGMILRCLKHNVKAYIKDDNNIVHITDKPVIISGKKGMTFSLQAYGDMTKGVNIIGAKYPLNDYDLEIGDPRTVSNEFLDEDVEITFSSGRLLIIYSRD